LSKRLFVILGEASFSFYLLHLFILNKLEKLLLLNYSVWQTWLFVITLYFGTTALAIIVNKKIEEPVRKLLVNTFSNKFAQVAINL
jgi:peptidoglycan/LPS O-acetylase OafA/YrhL